MGGDPVDDELAAFRAEGVLLGVAGDISHIREPKAGLRRDLVRPLNRRDGRGWNVLNLVRRIVAGEVKRDIWAEFLLHPLAELGNLFIAIIKRRNKQYHNLVPNPHLFQKLQCIQNRRERSITYVAVEFLGERLQVDLDRGQVLAEILHRLPLNKTVGDHDAAQSLAFRKLCSLVHVLVIDDRLRIGKGNGGALLLEGHLHHFFRRHVG